MNDVTRTSKDLVARLRSVESRGERTIWTDAADEIERLRRQNSNLLDTVNAKQARIDALMLEFCPGEMSLSQRAAWQASQERAAPEPESSRLTDSQCDEIIAALEAREWRGLTPDDVRLLSETIDTYRTPPPEVRNLGRDAWPDVPDAEWLRKLASDVFSDHHRQHDTHNRLLQIAERLSQPPEDSCTDPEAPCASEMALRTLEREVAAVLDSLGTRAIRVREGGADENIAASLALTVAGLTRAAQPPGAGDWPALAAEAYESNNPNLPSTTAVLQRMIERHVKWREEALGYLRQVVDGRGCEDEWPALAEFIEQSDSRIIASSSETKEGE